MSIQTTVLASIHANPSNVGAIVGNKSSLQRKPTPNYRRLAFGSLFAFVVLMPTYAYAHNSFEFQTPVTPVARETLYIHNLFLVIIAILFAVGMSFLLYAVFRHRKSRGHLPVIFTGPRTRTQWVLVVIPFLVFVFIDYIILGIPAYHAVLAMANTRQGANLVVKITASQWKWRYEYPDDQIAFTSNLSTPREQLENSSPTDAHYLLEVDRPFVLPVGEKVRILLTSTDVLHSWWVPSFGVKLDAVPGFLRETWVKIDRPGVYRGQCAELCGVGHAFMPIEVVAKTKPEFRKWLEQARAAEKKTSVEATQTLSLDELLVRGKKAYESNCAACHEENGLGIAGNFPPLAAGRAFSATPEMTDKLARRGFYRDGRIVLGSVDQHVGIVLHGVPGTPMPAFGPQLSDIDIAAIVTYERNSFGNHTGEAVQATTVKNARRESPDHEPQ